MAAIFKTSCAAQCVLRFCFPLIQIILLWAQERSALAPWCVELGPRGLH